MSDFVTDYEMDGIQKVDKNHKEVEVWASNTLSRTATIQSYSDSLKKDFENQHFTIQQILIYLQEIVREINLHGLSDYTLDKLNLLARESELWIEDETEVVPA